MADLFGYSISNSYLGGGAGGIILLIFLFWFFMRRSGGRIGIEKEEIQEDKQLRVDDERILQAARDEKNQAQLLLNLMKRLETKLQEIIYGATQQQKKQFAYIVEGLQILMSEGNSVLQDKRAILVINSAINAYLNLIPSDTRINPLVQDIKDCQKRLFGDILTQDEFVRKKFDLLRRETEETIKEEGKAA